MKASYDSFDLGTDEWDLVVMVCAWAPVADPAFVARLFTTDVWGITPAAMSLSGRG